MAASQLGIVHAVVIVEQVSGMLGVAVLAALTWRRATGAGAVAASVVMAPFFYFGNIPAACWPEWYAWLVARVADAYKVAGIATIVAVSLLTRQHDPRAVAEFYARADTPIGEEDRLRAAGFEADTIEKLNKSELTADAKEHDKSKRLLLLDFFTWPALVLSGRAQLGDYRLDWAGLAGSVFFILVFLWALSRLGGMALT